jgi:hypothetical protein
MQSKQMEWWSSGTRQSRSALVYRACLFGHGEGVERNITERIARRHAGKFGRILVPTEEVVEMKNGTSAPPSVVSSRAMCWSKW